MPRIHHVSIEISRDLTGQEVVFWEALGFVPVEAPEGISSSAVWLEAGDQQIHLIPVDRPSLPGSGHVALVPADFEATLGEVRRAGFEVVPATAHWGSPRARATAPSGYSVELMAAPPAR